MGLVVEGRQPGPWTAEITEEPPALKAQGEGVCYLLSQTVTQEPPRGQLRTNVLDAPLVAPGLLSLELYVRDQSLQQEAAQG